MTECVVGTGIDLVENQRMADVLDRWNSRFRDRVFTESEQRYCEAKASPPRHYAGRFAVKEAVAKAFGLGMTPRLSWRDVTVVNCPSSGAPSVSLSPRGWALAREKGVSRMKVSLSHTRHYAVAHAFLLGPGLSTDTE